jgi:sugar/nucleoside kinase (ribokinase family)
MTQTILVAGHLCLDVFPTILTTSHLEPGRLIDAGKTTFATGGTVSNVGLALHRLGATVKLIGKIGDDLFGREIIRIFEAYDPALSENLITSRDHQTSHTIVLSPPKTDRIFIHHPGCNDDFSSRDLPEILQADWFHFGYPPLMAKMYENGGEELRSVFRMAKLQNLTTSLDLSLPDPSGASARVDWKCILGRVLPLVDFFLPSEDEIMLMTGLNTAEECADWSIDQGAKSVVIKRGDRGLLAFHQGEKYEQKVFPVEVIGTTGSGDATIAGFIYAQTNGQDFARSLKFACAVGAACCTALDAISGIPTAKQITDLYIGL